MEFDWIAFNPNRINGQACIRDARFAVRRVLLELAICPDREELRPEYPSLEDEDIRQALEYAAAPLDQPDSFDLYEGPTREMKL